VAGQDEEEVHVKRFQKHCNSKLRHHLLQKRLYEKTDRNVRMLFEYVAEIAQVKFSYCQVTRIFDKRKDERFVNYRCRLIFGLSKRIEQGKKVGCGSNFNLPATLTH